MSVVQSNLPDKATLYDVLPQSEYMHSTAFEQRTIRPVASTEAGLIGTASSVGITFNFPIQKSAVSLISLQETYFRVAGYLTISQTTLDADVSKSCFSRDCMKASNQWLLSLFQKVTLYLEGKEVEQRTVPIRYNDYNYAMETHCRDAEKGVFAQNQMFSGENILTVPTINTTTGSTTFVEPTVSNVRFGGNPVDIYIGDFSFVNAGTTSTTVTTSIKVPFSCYLPLTAMFTVHDYKPIFNTDINVQLLRETTNNVSIALGPNNNVSLDQFTVFQLDVVSYRMNEGFAKLVQGVYRKPQIVVCGISLDNNQNLYNQAASQSVQFQCPMPTFFDLKDLHIMLPKNIANAIVPGSVFKSQVVTGQVNRYLSKWTNTAPHCYLPFPISAIDIKADDYTLFSRLLSDADVTLQCSPTRDDNINTTIGYNGTTTTTISNFYTVLYHNMLLCRRYHDVLDDGVTPTQFFRDKFMISIPCYQFSRLTTGSRLMMTFTWPSYIWNSFAYPAAAANAIPVGTVPNLTQILIIQHATRAIRFGPEGVSVQNITQRISNDIEIENM